MKKSIQRFVSFVLAIGVFFSMLTPIPVFAEEGAELLFHLALDGNTENSVKKNPDAKMVGDIIFEEGILGQAARIRNTSNKAAKQYITFDEADIYKVKDENFALSLWYKTVEGGGDERAIISNKDWASGSNTGFTLGHFDNGARVNFTADGASRKDIYGIEIVDDLWHQVVINVDRSSKVKVYIDGKQKKDLDVNSLQGLSIDVEGLGWTIGADSKFTQGLKDALVDEVKLYKGLLNENQIEKDYTSTMGTYNLNQFKSFYESIKGNSNYSTESKNLLLSKIELLEAQLKEEKFDSMQSLIKEIGQVIEELLENGSEHTVPGQVLYLNFDDNTKDLSGYGNDGVIAGDVTYEKGIEGNAVRIKNDTNGVAEQYVRLNESESLKFKDKNFAISMWYQTNNGGGDERAILSNKDWGSGSNTGFTLGNFTNGGRVNFTAEGTARKDIYNLKIVDDAWHHIVINTNRSGNLDVYIDGVLTSSTNIQGSLGKSIDIEGLGWTIGADSKFTQGLEDGLIDELRMFNRLLSAQEISGLYASQRLQNLVDDAHDFLASDSTNNYSEQRINEFKISLSKIETMIENESETDTRIIRNFGLMYERLEQKEEPLFTFDAFTDTHLDGEDDSVPSNVNLINAYKDRQFLNPTSSVITNSGDFTDTGSLPQYKGHYSIIERFAEIPVITALGNHDVRWLCSQTQNMNPYEGTCVNNDSPFAKRYLELNGPHMEGDNNWDGKSLYYDMWIEGYHFIVLNTEKDLKDHSYLSPEQLAWLDETMAINYDENKPVFILLHQVLEGTAEYIEGDLVGEQDQALKDVLKKHPNGVLLTGHIHSGIDRADIYKRDWGFLYDMPSFKYVYAGGDSRSQLGFQVNVFEDKIQIKPRDYGMNTWIEDHVVEFSLKDERQVPNDDSNDLDNSKFTATAGTSQSGEDVSNLFDNDETTIWHSKWSGDGTSREDTYIQLDFNEPTKVNGLRYLPRQSGTNGNIKDYKILTSIDNGATWEKVSEGTLKTNSSWKVLPIPEEVITNLKLVIVTNSGSGIYGSGAELRVFSTRTDVTSLELLLEKVNNLDISNLTETSIKTVIDIKEKLTEAISNENILAAEVVELVEDVNKQLATLEIIKLDYTKLEEYIAEIEALDLTLYTRDSVESLNTVLSEAKSLVNNAVSQEEIDTIYLKLKNACSQLIKEPIEKVIDYSQLKSALKEIATIDLKIYTESSRLDLNAVIVEAQALINNAESQEQVDSMIKKLNIAFKELKLIEDTTDDNELPGTGVSSQSYGIGLGLIAMGYVLTIRKRKSRLQ